MATPIDNTVEQKWMNEVSPDESLSAILNALSKTKAVVITGVPGIGKTALAHQVAQQMPVIIVDETYHLEKSNGNLYETLATIHKDGTPLLVTAQRISPRLQYFIDRVHADVIALPL